MPSITSVERIAEPGGKVCGEVKGRAGVLRRPLTRLFGPVPAESEQRVRQLLVERLEALVDAVLDFRGLEGVQALLDRYGVPVQ